MDFNLSENTIMIADTAKRYLKDQYSFDIYRNVIARSNHLESSRWQMMQELGWFGLPFSEVAGGYGGDLIDVAMIVSEMGAALCLDPYVDMVVAPGKLLELVDSEPARQLLVSIIEGKSAVACAFYDTHSGYDALNPSLVIDGNRLSGQKSFVPDGGFAQSVLATARRGEELALVHVRLSNCEVDSHRALDGSRMSNIVFDDVMLDDDAIIACGSEAVAAASQTLGWLRALDCARMYGAARALYEKTLDYAKTRKQFAVHIGSFQVIQHYLVDMFIDLQQLESMLLMVSIKAACEDPLVRDRACAAAKAYFADRAVRIAQQAIQIHGGVGVTEELDVGHYFRLITHCSLSHGARDMQIEQFAALSEDAHG